MTHNAKRIARVKVTHADGEYVVKAYGSDGARMPEADYFTNDKRDAEETASVMVDEVAHCRKCGHECAKWQAEACLCPNEKCENSIGYH